MQLLDPTPFVANVSVCDEEDSGEPPVLEIPVTVPEFTSDNVWDAFSEDLADFVADVFDEASAPDGHPLYVISEEESVGDGEGDDGEGDDGEGEPPLDDDSAGVSNPFDTPDPALAWRLANMPDEVFMELLLSEFSVLELEELSPQ